MALRCAGTITRSAAPSSCDLANGAARGIGKEAGPQAARDSVAGTYRTELFVRTQSNNLPRFESPGLGKNGLDVHRGYPANPAAMPEHQSRLDPCLGD